MAWMFAGTENDMTIGFHMHYHLVPMPAPTPVPFYPHPAMGILGDKLCENVKADNRKAAKTGTKAKVLMPPHLPLIGPLTTGVAKENTGLQQVWMGAGIGAHPFGGIKFVVLEGKPAAGMLSNCMGCWGTAPGCDMMLPFIGADFVMIPTRAVTVMYGPAPLAIDLYVLLLSMIGNVFEKILSKIPDGIWNVIAQVGFGALMEGAEKFVEEIEAGKSPLDALKSAAEETGYGLIKGTIAAVLQHPALVGSFLGDSAGPWVQWGADMVVAHVAESVAEDVTESVKEMISGEPEAKGGLEAPAGPSDFDVGFTESAWPDPVGVFSQPPAVLEQPAGGMSPAQQAAWNEQDATSQAAREKADAAQTIMTHPDATPEQREQATQAFQESQQERKAAEDRMRQIEGGAPAAPQKEVLLDGRPKEQALTEQQQQVQAEQGLQHQAKQDEINDQLNPGRLDPGQAMLA